MNRSKLVVFEQQAGPSEDSPARAEMAEFAADLAWLEKQGVGILRLNLASNPDEFEQYDSAKEALAKEGNDCLPLIVADGEIVSQRRYPSRDELAKMSGLGADSAEDEPQSTVADPGLPAEEEPPQCLPGCSCSAKRAGVGPKVLIILTLLVLASGALAYYKVSGGRDSSEDQPTIIGQAADEGRAGNPLSFPKAEALPVEAPGGFGTVLPSINDLNSVAMDKDGVFILIPGSNNEKAGADAIAAANSAKTRLDQSRIAVGLFSLSTKAAEYEGIARQVETPAFLVVCKGRGMVAVTGEVTEAKLMQAFLAASNAGGGCGPTCGATQ